MTYNIGYARVSSADNRQIIGLAVQQSALSHCDIIFCDKDSGANDTRQQLQKALKLAKYHAKKGKQVTLTIYKLDRLTRQLFTLVQLIQELNHHHITLVSLTEQLDTHSTIGKMMCLLIGYVAEMELENIRNRTKDGLQKAKERGIKLGRPPIPHEKAHEIITYYQQKTLSVRQIAQQFQISPSTLYHLLKRYNIRSHK